LGISVGIKELEAPSAACRSYKTDIRRIMMTDTAGFEDAAEHDEKVPLERAMTEFPDWEAFLRRNRINPETDAVYMDKVKNADDRERLEPLAERTPTGWVDFPALDPGRAGRALESSKNEDRVTGWDLLDFDTMNGICSGCPLSWDKGRGCIGSFGPDGSLLPEIAARHGCGIIASVPEGVASGRVYTPSEAREMLRETEVLATALPSEGKMMVRRYSGPLERLSAVARISSEEGCGFYFF